LRTFSTDSLTASSPNKLSAYSVNSVNKNPVTLHPFRPMPIVEFDISLMSLCILVWVLLTCNEPGHCKFGTCCVRTIEDKIATELRTNLLRMKQTKIINKSGPGASGTLRYSRCESRRMFTKLPSPLRREAACRSHDYQFTLSVPLHTLSGPGTTLHGQVLLSDRLRQTFLTTSLEAVQAIIYGRVLEARI